LNLEKKRIQGGEKKESLMGFPIKGMEKRAERALRGPKVNSKTNGQKKGVQQLQPRGGFVGGRRLGENHRQKLSKGKTYCGAPVVASTTGKIAKGGGNDGKSGKRNQ